MSRLPTLSPTLPPLHADTTGTIRVGETRVPFDTVVAAFLAGATPEEIVVRYPALRLADAYATIAYYLQRTDEVDAYLAERRASAQALRHDLETRFDPTGSRARLLARRDPPLPDDPVSG